VLPGAVTRPTTALVLGLVLAASCAAQPARAALIYRYNPGAPAPATRAPTHTSTLRASSPAPRASSGMPRVSTRPPRVSTRPPRAPSRTPRAPSGPPLVAGAAGAELPGAGSAGALAAADASSSAASSGGDPLVGNGLGSPLCGAGAGELSAQSWRNCRTSGFEAAGAPTGDYALDVHIDTGPLGFTVATLEQDYLIAPVWMGLVWVVHTLVVAIEWGFTLDLLGGSAMAAVGRTLRSAQTSFTRPLLACALALAAIGAAYNGLVRRRVAETLGQAALTLAMIAGGLWVMADPAGTVGALGRWIDAASTGTFGALVEGSPARAQRTLADSMGGLFAGAVGDPWCYLEFGAVRWCDEPALRDRSLRAAALRIASAAQPGGCGIGASDPAACQALEGEQPAGRVQSAKLLRAARTNGDLFLALPANQAARNSINDSASLLRALCGGSTDATGCRGATAAQAEFRTQSGTAPRIGGLLLIALGALGMLLLFGYIALHLLGSELLSLLYLLLAPLAVLAPALGDGGRAAFANWAQRIAGAVASKLLFSFLLGSVLLLTHTLLTLYALGWWTRWLLVSATWWGAYLQRRRLVGFVRGELRSHGRAGRDGARHSRHDALLSQTERRSPLAWRVQRRIEFPLAAVRVARAAGRRLPTPAPYVERRHPRKNAGAGGAPTLGRAQAAQMLEREHAQVLEELAEAPRVRAETGKRRLQRLRIARARAAEHGDARRVAVLDVRARRVEEELALRERGLSSAQERAAVGERARRMTGVPYSRGELARRGRFLDAQAALPPSARRGARVVNGVEPSARPDIAGQRDYAALASLVGYGREQYERLDPRHRRDARLQIDRELALRRRSPAQELLGSRGNSPVGALGGAEPASTGQRTSATPANRESPSSQEESPLMRDFRAVAEGHKERLGFDR
jgi:hypothetical protein